MLKNYNFQIFHKKQLFTVFISFRTKRRTYPSNHQIVPNVASEPATILLDFIYQYAHILCFGLVETNNKIVVPFKSELIITIYSVKTLPVSPVLVTFNFVCTIVSISETYQCVFTYARRKVRLNLPWWTTFCTYCIIGAVTQLIGNAQSWLRYYLLYINKNPV